MWVLSYLVWRCDISVEFKHLVSYIVVSSLFDTPSKETVGSMLSLNHPIGHVLSWFDDVTTHTATLLSAVIGFECPTWFCFHASSSSKSGMYITSSAPHSGQ